MNEKQSITNYIYSKLQEAKKTSTEGKPAKTLKAKKTSTEGKPSKAKKPAAPHPYDSSERVARRKERGLINARLAQKALRAKLKEMTPEEREEKEPEIQRQIDRWVDSVKEQQEYIADFVKNLLTEQRKKKTVHTNADGEKWTQNHIDSAVNSGPPLANEHGSLEHIFDAHYDPSTGRVTNKHTGEELPGHITDFFDDRNSHESRHVKPLNIFLEPPKDDEEPD